MPPKNNLKLLRKIIADRNISIARRLDNEMGTSLTENAIQKRVKMDEDQRRKAGIKTITDLAAEYASNSDTINKSVLSLAPTLQAINSKTFPPPMLPAAAPAPALAAPAPIPALAAPAAPAAIPAAPGAPAMPVAPGAPAPVTPKKKTGVVLSSPLPSSLATPGTPVAPMMFGNIPYGEAMKAVLDWHNGQNAVTYVPRQYVPTETNVFIIGKNTKTTNAKFLTFDKATFDMINNGTEVKKIDVTVSDDEKGSKGAKKYKITPAGFYLLFARKYDANDDFYKDAVQNATQIDHDLMREIKNSIDKIGTTKKAAIDTFFADWKANQNKPKTKPSFMTGLYMGDPRNNTTNPEFPIYVKNDPKNGEMFTIGDGIATQKKILFVKGLADYMQSGSINKVTLEIDDPSGSNSMTRHATPPLIYALFMEANQAEHTAMVNRIKPADYEFLDIFLESYQTLSGHLEHVGVLLGMYDELHANDTPPSPQKYNMYAPSAPSTPSSSQPSGSQSGSGLSPALSNRNLKNRFNVLKGALTIGNDNPQVKNEFIAIADSLFSAGKIKRREHEDAYRLIGVAA